MFQRKPLSVAVQRAVTGVAVAATAVAIPAVALAQSNSLEEVVVTGSRIAQDPNQIASSPVTMVKATEISNRGVIRVEDLMNKLPAIVPELTANESNGATGTATLDLRGLGSDRTLVLTNGHRMGLGDVFALAPDINQIPGGLIDRVEVLTGGASSTYGSDAVAGVVNFVLKDNFEGVQINYQYSAYQHDQGNSVIQNDIANAGFTQAPGSVWDGDANDIDLIMGVNSADGKGNITAYVGYRHVDPVIQADRDYSVCALNGNEGQGCGGSSTLPEGRITDFAGGFDWIVSGTNFVPRNGLLYNYAGPNHYQRPDERWTGGLFGHYKVNEHVEGYTEFQFMNDYSNAQIAPSGDFFVNGLTIGGAFTPGQFSCANPLLSAQEFTAIGCTAPTDIVTAYIGRRNVEGGFRNDDITHTSWRTLVGVRGQITDDWSYDAFANFSRTNLSELYNNDLSTTRIVRALDVVDDGSGNAVCRSVVDGSDPNCVPWNIFQTGGVTQDQLNYLYLNLFSKGLLKQDQYVGYVNGDLTNYGFVSPWARDGVKVVLGGEYRSEYMNYKPDDGYQAGDGAGQGGPTAAVMGTKKVTEFFMEGKIPVAQDMDYIKSLSLDVGYRYSDYDSGVTTDTYKFAGQWSPNDTVKIRGGYSHAVRAANIRELFEPSNLGLWSGTDPCAGAKPEQTAAQCANSGVTAAMYGSVPDSPAGQFNAHFGGNTALQPESSDSYTIGAVFNMDEYIPNLSFSIDYWSVSVDGAIAYDDPEFNVRQCGLTGDAQYCNKVHRSAANGNLWVGSSSVSPYVESQNVNIGFYDTSGIDIIGNYSYDVGRYGSLDFNFRGTWVEAYDQQLNPAASIDPCGGKWGGTCGRPRPSWKHVFNTTWNTPWNVTANLAWRYIEGVDGYQGDAAYNASDRHYFDFSAVYTPTFINIGETKLRFGVNNLLDQDPPASGYFADVAVYGNGNTIPGTWDALGRYFFFGVTQKF